MFEFISLLKIMELACRQNIWKKYMNPIVGRMEPEYIKQRVPVWEWR